MADGHARSYVAYGKQYVIHHHHQGGLADGPMNPAALRRWAERLLTEYRKMVAENALPCSRRTRTKYERNLADLVEGLTEPTLETSALAHLRRLISAGAAQYIYRASSLPDEALPSAVFMDFAVYMLWPVVAERRLPEGWQEALAEISSPATVHMVEQTREAMEKYGRQKVSAEIFARYMATMPFAPGILGLLEDLCDPKGAGACLSAIAVACGYPEPPAKVNSKNLLKWALWVSGGLVATRVDDLVGQIWEWLRGHKKGYGGSSFDPDDPYIYLHGSGGSERGNSVLGEFADVLFD
ncbi:hypothetical protein [Actinomadura kijaniata]|uniref:hypothetical protein n=1 Tax=Actinomadura kijaniata TaxID=46161 RepID=UPI00147204F5|nr:hypothetical protein [Actinomadura kijaniata]